MEWILPLLGGLGIGSLLKSAIDHWIVRKAAASDRLYQEKREAYLGLLEALHRAAVRASDENAKNFGFWRLRCDLFGSPQVSRYAQQVAETDGQTPERTQAFNSLVQAMRDDLNK